MQGFATRSRAPAKQLHTAGGQFFGFFFFFPVTEREEGEREDREG